MPAPGQSLGLGSPPKGCRAYRSLLSFFRLMRLGDGRPHSLKSGFPMSFANQNERFRPTALALAAGLCLQLAACGGDDDAPPPVQTLTCADLNGRTVAAAGIGLP